MTDKEQIAYLRHVIDKLNTLAYDNRDEHFMAYVKRLTSEALTRVLYGA